MGKLVSVGRLTIVDVNDGLSIRLSSDSHIIPTNPLGEEGIYFGAKSTVSVYSGKTDITERFTITCTASVGITGSLEGRTYTVTDMTTASGTVDFVLTGGGTDPLQATFALIKSSKVSQAVNGLTISISNESHVLPADGDGTVSSYANSGTAFKVFEGLTELNALVGATAPSSFSVGTPTSSPEAVITVGSITHTGTTVTVAPHSDFDTATDTVALYFPITIQRENGISISLLKMQTLTKVKSFSGEIVAGMRGTVHLHKLITGSIWSDSEANALFAEGEYHYPLRVADRVTLYNPTAKFSQTRAWTGTAWEIQTEVLDGNLLVSQSVTANAINTNDLYSKNATVTGQLLVGTVDNGILLRGGASTQINAKQAGKTLFSINSEGTGFIDGKGLGATTVEFEALSGTALTKLAEYLGATAPVTGGTISISQALAAGSFPLSAVTSNGGAVTLAFNCGQTYHLRPPGSPPPPIPSITLKYYRGTTLLVERNYDGDIWDGAGGEPGENSQWEVYLPVINDTYVDNAAPDATEVTYRVDITLTNYAYGSANYANFTFSASQQATSGSTSDLRLKSDLEPITDALSKLNQLAGYTFNKVGKTHRQAGYIAQELEQVLPEGVQEKMGIKHVDDSATLGLVIEAIKELNNKVDRLLTSTQK